MSSNLFKDIGHKLEYGSQEMVLLIFATVILWSCLFQFILHIAAKWASFKSTNMILPSPVRLCLITHHNLTKIQTHVCGAPGLCNQATVSLWPLHLSTSLMIYGEPTWHSTYSKPSFSCNFNLQAQGFLLRILALHLSVCQAPTWTFPVAQW